jgi:hypothetical protein
MLASMCTRIPPTPKDCSSAARRRRPAALALASSPGASTTANSSQPRQRVALAQRRLQPRADLAQDLVARVMPERVVELLEAVEVDQQQRDLAVVALDRLAEPGEQVAAVAEPGEVVRDRVPLAGAQAVDDREPGARHPGQHGDRRQRCGDGRQAHELADDEQRQRRGGVRQDRRQHDRAELGARLGPRVGDQARGDQRHDRQQGQLPQRAQTDERAGQRQAHAPAGEPEGRRDPDGRHGRGQLRACGDGERADRAAAQREIEPRHRQRRPEPPLDHHQHARGHQRAGRDVERLPGPELVRCRRRQRGREQQGRQPAVAALQRTRGARERAAHQDHTGHHLALSKQPFLSPANAPDSIHQAGRSISKSSVTTV